MKHGECRWPQTNENLNRVAVLSYGSWTRVFGAERNVIGRVVQLNQIPYQIVGVMRADFELPWNTDVWTPIGLDQQVNIKPGMHFRAIPGNRNFG